MAVGPVSRDASTSAFFDGARQHRFLLKRCGRCGAYSAPPASLCHECRSPSLTDAAADGDATLVSWTVTHTRPDASGATKRTVLAIAELTEGPWWWSQLVDVDPDDLAVGQPLLIDFPAVDGFEVVPVFRRADGDPGVTARTGP